MQKLKTSRIAILISNKADFTQKLLRRVKEGYYILIKVTIHQEDITVLNIYALNINAPKFIKEALLCLKEQIRLDTITVGDLNAPCSSLDITSRQRISKDILY
jgi:hypothetical protein